MRSINAARRPRHDALLHSPILPLQGDVIALRWLADAYLSSFSDFCTGSTLNAPRLSIIPAGAVTDRSLEPRDLQVLCLLGRHTDKAGWCVRSQVKMAREIACSRGSLQNSLDRLVLAGWVEKKRLDTEVEDAGKHPSRSYAYRVLLDRDDYALESINRDAPDDDAESHAENASEEGGCQPVGTPVPVDQHPGANPCVGTRANTYVGTKNVPLERPPLERERDARARDAKEKFKAAFKAKWPDVAADSQQRLNYALEGLPAEEEAACIAGIEPFLAALKRKGRQSTPAASTYVEERRWTLLDVKPDGSSAPAGQYPRDSVETKAVRVLYDVAGCTDAFHRFMLRGETLYYRGEITPKLLALATAPKREEWVALDRQQAAAWEHLLSEGVTVSARNRLRDGSLAPWPWPPRKDGTLSPTGPPDSLMTAEDFKDFQ
ncbi:helix-turn-helix domain-containing protein [Bradyrhizobium sp. ORS 86]|uniref:helix-turn-helix domain-containing protein n=1 Tax=Bradyrhizobium sp. ORS 86 TaxID=1685970 RepID=UPI00388E2807